MLGTKIRWVQCRAARKAIDVLHQPYHEEVAGAEECHTLCGTVTGCMGFVLSPLNDGSEGSAPFLCRPKISLGSKARWEAVASAEAAEATTGTYLLGGCNNHVRE